MNMLFNVKNFMTMIFSEHNQQQMEIVARFLAGEMGDEERTNFEREMNRHDENIEFVAKMEKEWKLMGKFKQSVVDTDSGWAKMIARLEQDDLIPAKNNVPLHRYRIRPTMRWAAVAMVILAVGSLIVYVNSKMYVSPQIVNLTTGKEQNALVHTLGDGSVVYLASNTSLAFPKVFDSKGRKVELNKGEAFFDIARNPQSPFFIETKDVTIQVLGTAFNVKKASQSNFELIVERGLVKVTLKVGNSESFFVKAGERFTVVGNKITKAENQDVGYRAWRTKRMQFKDERLQDVIMVLNKNYHSNIVLSSSDLFDRRLTVTFSNNTISAITDLICQAMNLKSERRMDTLFISKSDEPNER